MTSRNFVIETALVIKQVFCIRKVVGFYFLLLFFNRIPFKSYEHSSFDISPNVPKIEAINLFNVIYFVTRFREE